MGGFFAPDVSSTNQVIGFRNRIINGAMRIDQRNVGTSISIAASGGSVYVNDRFSVVNNLANAVTAQQVILGSSGSPPKLPTASSANHTHALQWTNSSTASTSTTVTNYLQTFIEANTCVDFGWGNVNPRTVTLSFWAYCSVAGPYSLTVFPGASSGGASYTTVYTITTASVWQQFKLTIPGPAIGTWASDTSALFGLLWGLHGSGASTATATLNTWTTTTGIVSTTQTNLGTTASSTFALTGAQLELGTLATSFEWRPWETEIRMCQRYYEKSWEYSVSIASGIANSVLAGIVFGTAYSASNMSGFAWRIEKRTIPSVVTYSCATPAVANSISAGTGSAATGTVGYSSVSTKVMSYFTSNGFNFTFPAVYYWQYTAAADFPPGG